MQQKDFIILKNILIFFGGGGDRIIIKKIREDFLMEVMKKI